MSTNKQFTLPKLRNGTRVRYLAHETTIKNAVFGYPDLYELHGLEGAFHESEFTLVDQKPKTNNNEQ